jgi:TRAP-type mannitol/chloroaromatic compound transport system permease small subunit
MANGIKKFIQYTDTTSTVVGRGSQYIVLVMIGILLFESISRTMFNRPHIWVVEISQFLMAAYYLLGGGYSMLMKGHVRMDLLYGRWSKKQRALADILTGPFLIFYLVFLLIGAGSSIDYALEYGQRNYTPWAPPLAPIKIVMAIGILVMLLQAIATFFKDIRKVKEKESYEP